MNIDFSSFIKRYALTFIKVVGFLAILYLIYHLVFDEIDFRLMLNHIKEANPFFLLLGLISMILKFASFGIKFKISASYFGARIKTKKYILNEFKLLFLELLFPIPNSEDFFRVLFHKLKNIELHKCISIVMVMRISSIVTIVFLLVGLIIELNSVFIKSKFWLAAGLFTFLLTIILTYKFWINIALKFINKPKWIVKLLSDIVDNSITMKQYSILTSFSFINYFFSALAIYFILLSIGFELNLLKILVIIPALIFSFILPLSIQGYGLPEAALLFLLIQFGIPEETATAAALLHLSFYTSLIILGALLFLIDKDYDLKVIREQIKTSSKKIFNE